MDTSIDYKRLYELSIIEKETLLNKINDCEKKINELKIDV